MPIYEFKCKDCGTVFEFLQIRKDDDDAPCPCCGKNDTERLLSTFSSRCTSGQNTVAPAASASCGSSGGFS